LERRLGVAVAKTTIILGGGFTGLATGVASGCPVFEAASAPGGICSSYYVRPRTAERLPVQPADGDAYRFELGGGHWIFGGNPAVLRFINETTPVRRYARRSSVWLDDGQVRVPYPIQNHLRGLGADVATTALAEMARPGRPARTMKGWLEQSFGPTLCERFFFPFHDLYTAGLYDRIAPQDAYKSPVELALAIRGALSDTPAVGYNTDFAYPEDGLDALARHLARRGDVRFGNRAMRVDLGARTVVFENGATIPYDRLVSTLPLNQMLTMAGLDAGPPDPHTSVLVLNLGARRGPRCPDDHWLYFAKSDAGFHRVGFYDNVDPSFLPASVRDQRNRTSIYVERAFLADQSPSPAAVLDYQAAVARELQSWGIIEDVEVSDPTWIEVAYTWSWPGSSWVRRATNLLEQNGILSIGRYGRWSFQGIAESLHEGFAAGAMLRAG
jgi:protoporphyrinogen oxidase